jgi:large subunit ribosomal protein L22
MLKSFARQKNIWMTPRKLRRVVDQIRGKGVEEAYAILKLMPYKASDVVLKKLVEATHNAALAHGLALSDLTVVEAFVDEGSRITRFKPRAQGRIYKRLKRTSHVAIAVGQA